MTVVWTTKAQDHLDSIYAYIARDSSLYALRMVDRITRRSQQIADAPLSGRRVPEYQQEHIRELVEDSYRIIYFVRLEQIEILAVIHAARNITDLE